VPCPWSLRYQLLKTIKLFTHSFPCANIHELLSPDLLHQVIKGTFKDHLVTWVQEYIELVHPRSQAEGIIHDIDRRYQPFPY
jgi:hypothetical protein